MVTMYTGLPSRLKNLDDVKNVRLIVSASIFITLIHIGDHYWFVMKFYFNKLKDKTLNSNFADQNFLTNENYEVSICLSQT